MMFFISKPIGIFILVTLLLSSILLVMDIVWLIKDLKRKKEKEKPKNETVQDND